MVMIGTRAIGIDPGPTPGMVILSMTRAADGVQIRAIDVVQCSHRLAPGILDMVLMLKVRTLVQVETFVIGRGSMRSGQAGAVTRDLVGELQQVWEDHDSTILGRLGGHWYQRSASQVKPWATDERLEAAGLLDVTKGMRHARDAARHALYCAVHDGGLRDPLSKSKRWVCPECAGGKHVNCNGMAWDDDADELTPCGCCGKRSLS